LTKHKNKHNYKTLPAARPGWGPGIFYGPLWGPT